MFIFADTDPTSNPLNDFLKNYGIWIAIALAGAVFVAVVIMFVVALIKRKREPSYKPKEIVQTQRSKDILIALGGLENIIDHSFVGSRMSVVLKDYSLLDEEKLKSLQVDSIIKMSEKVILVIKDDLSTIYQEMFH
ncbi:MAG: hypothetical protein MJ221_03140 [Bacilli bacterium]|nr:hypothetical protein [Bacilli bacterium]